MSIAPQTNFLWLDCTQVLRIAIGPARSEDGAIPDNEEQVTAVESLRWRALNGQHEALPALVQVVTETNWGAPLDRAFLYVQTLATNDQLLDLAKHFFEVFQLNGRGGSVTARRLCQVVSLLQSRDETIDIASALNVVPAKLERILKTHQRSVDSV